MDINEKRHLEMEKRKIGWTKNIVEDYKREKEQLIWHSWQQKAFK